MNIINKVKDTIKKEGVLSLNKKACALITRKVFVRLPQPLKLLIAKKIKKFHSKDPESVLRYSFDVLGLLLRPIQIPEEFIKLLQKIPEIQPKVVMEIGTATGGSLLSFCKLAPEDATIISIDLPGGRFGGGYPEWETDIFKMFSGKNQSLHLIRGDSHSENTKDEILKILDGRKVDFMFIDGDHEYAGVKKDFEMYSTLVRQGGIIAFHDVAPNGDKNYAGGVPIFWKEIKNGYSYEEFIKDKDQRGFGIGCIKI